MYFYHPHFLYITGIWLVGGGGLGGGGVTKISHHFGELATRWRRELETKR